MTKALFQVQVLGWVYLGARYGLVVLGRFVDCGFRIASLVLRLTGKFQAGKKGRKMETCDVVELCISSQEERLRACRALDPQAQALRSCVPQNPNG